MNIHQVKTCVKVADASLENGQLKFTFVCDAKTHANPVGRVYLITSDTEIKK